MGREIFLKLPKIVSNIVDGLTLPEGETLETLTEKIRNKEYFSKLFYGDVEITNLTDLSVQQAVDLASLLMRLEVDFQKYTKDVPTVGGVIKLAVIDDIGFRFIYGDEVEPPKHIHL